MTNARTLLSTLAVILSITATPVLAQTVTDTPVPGHPRVNEIDQRLDNQQNRTSAGVNQGTIGATGAARDSARDARVSQELSTDEAKHNGHITKAEQAKMNRQLNRNSRKIHRQRATPGTAAAPVAAPAQ